MIDSAACEYAAHLEAHPISEESNRKLVEQSNKELARALFFAIPGPPSSSEPKPPTQLELLPLYSRLAGILKSVAPSIVDDVVTFLGLDFKFHVREKDRVTIESKVKVARYIGELTKLKIYPVAETVRCLELLLLNFAGDEIEMCCQLVETCGRFFFKQPESSLDTRKCLDEMVKKKSSLSSLDPHYVSLIESALNAAHSDSTEEDLEDDQSN